MKPLSGSMALVTALYIVAIFGTAHLVAASYPDAKAAKAWLGLGF